MAGFAYGNDTKIFNIFTGMLYNSANITDILNRFPTITLEEMDAVRLMNRTDTKYILPLTKLPAILEEASTGYRVLSIQEKRIFRYNSLYFDTPGVKTYFDHHNGIRPRYKVRVREYEDTGSLFLEVKRKISNERTRKSRIRLETIEPELSRRSRDYVTRHSPLDASGMIPSLWTIFRRITLVGKDDPERITLDIDLSFRYRDMEKTLPYLSICEVKRDQTRGGTPFMKILKGAKIYPSPCSKYCLGTILLKSPIKYNRFKTLILQINKIKDVYGSIPVTG